MQDVSGDVQTFDVIILGGGRGGMNLAASVSKAGKKCLVIERLDRMIGGSCINIACIPTKTFITGARMFNSVKHAGRYGIQTGDVSLDWLGLRKYVEEISHIYHEVNHSVLKDTENLSYIIGEGKFVDKKRIEIALGDGKTQTVAADTIVINTGTRPLKLNVPGSDLAHTSESIQKLDSLPRSLAIIGAGFVGIEFAHLFASLGTKVTLINSSSQLLPQEDDDVRSMLTDMFVAADVDVINEARLSKLESNNGQITVEFQKDGETSSIKSEIVLSAAGRVPNTERINAEKTGAKLSDDGFIKVNGKLETDCPGVFAIGDVNGGPQFTHVSYDDFRITRDHIIGSKTKTTTNRLIPFTLFTTPEISRVGLTERQAGEAGLDFEVHKFPLGMMPWAKMRGNDKGLLKLIIDKGTKRLVGTTVVTIDSAELLSIGQTAMVSDAPIEVLRDVIMSHPTLAEAYNFLLMGRKDYGSV